MIPLTSDDTRKHQIYRNQSKEKCARPLHGKLLNITERNSRRSKYIEGYIIFMNWKTQCFKDVNCPQNYL